MAANWRPYPWIFLQRGVRKTLMAPQSLIHTPLGGCCHARAASPIGSSSGLTVLLKDTGTNWEVAAIETATPSVTG